MAEALARPLEPLDTPAWPSIWTESRLQTATRAFLALGVLLRVFRYLTNPPLWGDEAFLATNFLDRGYLELLQPLEFHQVAPLLFLWIERFFVGLFGFSEWSLRLFPLLCGLGSLLVFERIATLTLRGVPRMLAVAIFAVSFTPLRHAVEVKPYASDLLAALVLLWCALAWWRRPETPARLWLLVSLVPLALGLSYPAVFLAGGIGLGLFMPVWQRRDLGTWIAYGTFHLVLCGSFAVVYLLMIRGQTEHAGLMTRLYWSEGFPPLSSPLRLIGWFGLVHTSHMLAYPAGGANGSSTITTVLVVVGILALWKRGRRRLLALVLAPFALGIVGAVLDKYPYGGSARTMQYVAPSVCLLAGLGAARLLGLARRPPRALRLSVGFLALIGLIEFATDLVTPYKQIEDQVARRFAQWFWPAMERQGIVACFERDLGSVITPQPWQRPRLAAYLCNQRIYSTRTGPLLPDSVNTDRPLRCVLFDPDPNHPAVMRWLDEMDARFTLQRIVQYAPLPDRVARGNPFEDRFVVYEFVPRPGLAGLAAQRPVRFRR